MIKRVLTKVEELVKIIENVQRTQESIQSEIRAIKDKLNVLAPKTENIDVIN